MSSGGYYRGKKIFDGEKNCAGFVLLDHIYRENSYLAERNYFDEVDDSDAGPSVS